MENNSTELGTTTNEDSQQVHIITLDMVINNPEFLVKTSFEDFMKVNGIEKSNLCKDNFDKWNFESDLEEKFKINLSNGEVVNQIPNLCTLINQNISGKLIKFECMIQNVIDNQLFMAAGLDEKSDSIILNKYFEHFSNKTDDIDDNANCNDDDLGFCKENTLNIMSDRLALNCISIPGMSEALKKVFDISEDLKGKKVVVYDYSNKYGKVNEEVLVIGIAYMIENYIIIHAWKIIRNFIPSFVVNAIDPKVGINFNEARAGLRELLKKLFNDDDLIAEYLLFFQASKIFSRVGTRIIGNLPLNIIAQTNNDNLNVACEYLKNLLRCLTLFYTDFNVTIENLNKNLMYPKFDPLTDELQSGILQTIDGTFLFLDERFMTEGKLNEIGIKNFSTIRNLIDFQSISYDYPYCSSVDICHDTEILILSSKSKSLFSSVFLIDIPFFNGISSYSPEKHNQLLEEFSTITQDSGMMSALKDYLTCIRYSSEVFDGFTIEQSLSDNMQKDFISLNEEFNSDDFDRVIKIARLNAVSFGRNYLMYEDYEFSKKCEAERKKRIAEFNKSKK